MESNQFDDFLPPGAKAGGTPPEGEAHDEGEGAHDGADRVVILRKGDAITLLTLRTDGEAGTFTRARLGSDEPPVVQHATAAEALGEFNRELRAHTKHHGWRVAYDGPPQHDRSDVRFQSMMDALGGLVDHPLEGESPDDLFHELDTRVIISSKGGALAITGLKTTPLGGKIQTVGLAESGDGDLQQPLTFDSPEAARREFAATRRRAEAAGWKHFYVGPPLIG